MKKSELIWKFSPNTYKFLKIKRLKLLSVLDNDKKYKKCVVPSWGLLSSVLSIFLNYFMDYQRVQLNHSTFLGINGRKGTRDHYTLRFSFIMTHPKTLSFKGLKLTKFHWTSVKSIKKILDSGFSREPQKKS